MSRNGWGYEDYQSLHSSLFPIDVYGKLVKLMQRPRTVKMQDIILDDSASDIDRHPDLMV